MIKPVTATESALEAVGEALRGSDATIDSELEEIVRRMERANALVGELRAVELSPYVVDLLAKAGSREPVLEGGLSAARA